MSSGFVTESEVLEARQKRQAEWEKVRQPDQPMGKLLLANELNTISIDCFVFVDVYFLLFHLFSVNFAELPEEPYDSRSLYERLKEQKDKKDLEFDESHKLSTIFSELCLCVCELNIEINSLHIFAYLENLIRGLDDDEVDFLDIIDKAKMDAEKKQQIEEDNELMEFRQRVATLQEKSIDQVRFDRNQFLNEMILYEFNI